MQLNGIIFKVYKKVVLRWSSCFCLALKFSPSSVVLYCSEDFKNAIHAGG